MVLWPMCPRHRHLQAAAEAASGVIFIAVEDETGKVNVIVWNNVPQKQRPELLGSTLLGVAGQIQREGGVIRLVAARLFDYSALFGKLNHDELGFSSIH